MPSEVRYDVDALVRLVRQDPDAVLAFYGGEPLLRMPLIEEMMTRVPARRFVLQTNGLLLRLVPDACLQRFDAILVSLDGRPETTDANRGAGVHRQVMENVQAVRPRFGGDLIARMTASQQTDIHDDVLHLLGQGFDHVHWQINAIWSPDGSWNDFSAWVETSYTPGLTRLADLWLGEMETGRVLGIVPFLGVLRRILFGGSGLPCGAGRDAFAVTTDGMILACPIGPDYDWNRIRPLEGAKPQDLKDQVPVGEPCTSCDLMPLCGGRCLFANREARWAEEHFRIVCGTVRHLVDEMRRIEPRVRGLLAAGVVTREALDYPPFNNTTEIIP